MFGFRDYQLSKQFAWQKCAVKGFDLAGQNARQRQMKANEGQCPVIMSSKKVWYSPDIFTVKSLATIQNVRLRTRYSPDKMSNEAQINFAYSEDWNKEMGLDCYLWQESLTLVFLHCIITIIMIKKPYPLHRCILHVGTPWSLVFAVCHFIMSGMLVL